MSAVHQPSRIDLAELKSQIVKTLGPDKARRYFGYLASLLNQKLSKVEFDKLCCLTIGHENLPLHNQFIRSILKNAHTGKVPPPPPVSNGTASIGTVVGKTSPNEDGYLKSPPPNATNSVVLSNGDIPASPRKGRSAKRDRRLLDRPSPLGPNGRTEVVAARHEASKGEAVPNIVENGDIYSYDLKRPIHLHEGIAEQPDNEGSSLMLPRPMKNPRLNRPAHANLHESINDLAEVALEAGRATGPIIPSSTQSGRPIHAPLGIPFCSASRGCAYRSSSIRGLPEVSYMSAANIGELSDTETLRKRMERIAEVEGLLGVPIDCANLLNNALDTYLKKLIRSCIEIARARPRSEQMKPVVHKQQPYGNVAHVINGLWHNHPMHSQPNSVPVQGLREAKNGPSISLLDFRVAMELNPQQLGEYWPSLLEKITSRSFEGE